MVETFFQPGPQRATRVRQLFGGIAPRYDLVNDLQSLGLHRRWKAKAAELAGVYRAALALDVCCGTGDLAFALAQRGARVVAIDFSPQMLAIAQGKKGRVISGKDGPTFILGDACRLMFGDNSFNIVTIGYGLRNLPDWKAGLEEMIRVLAPGGRIVILEFGKPKNGLWRSMYYAYLKAFVPLLGITICGSAGAYAYILESLEHYPAQQAIASGMVDLGLEGVAVHNILGGAMSIHTAQKPAGKV